MLKVEYPCREILSSCQNSGQSICIWSEAKKHLHDVRLRRQKQLAVNTDECHKLRNLHKQLFDRQLNSNFIEKSSDVKSINHEYSIPRRDYTSVIYRQLVPTFEVNKLENEIPIVREVTEYLTESSCPIRDEKTENHPSLSSRKTNLPRRLSVSSVSSADKRANKVYEQWPDYQQISEIVGYRIDPPVAKTITSTSSCLSNKLSQRKQNKPPGFPAASKQIRNAIGLNSSLTRRQSSKNKKLTKSDVTPDPPPPPPPPPSIILKPHIKETKPTLPTLLCPSSLLYSLRIQTRQWLVRNHFSSNALQTLPLL